MGQWFKVNYLRLSSLERSRFLNYYWFSCCTALPPISLSLSLSLSLCQFTYFYFILFTRLSSLSSFFLTSLPFFLFSLSFSLVQLSLHSQGCLTDRCPVPLLPHFLHFSVLPSLFLFPPLSLSFPPSLSSLCLSFPLFFFFFFFFFCLQISGRGKMKESIKYRSPTKHH